MAGQTERQRKFLDLLQRHELTFAALYGLFSRLLPGMSSFWDELAGEEKAHAEVIRELLKKLAKGEIQMKPLRPTESSVEASIADVEARIRSFSASGITASSALLLALELEQRMLEQSFFRVFEADSDYIQSEFAALSKHTTEHAARIQRQIKQLDAPLPDSANRTADHETPLRIESQELAPPATPAVQDSKASMDDQKRVISAQVRIINRLIEAELAMAELYEIFAGVYADISDFWQKLSEEEHGHARLLKTMFRFLDRGAIFHNIGRMDVLSIEAFARRVKDEIAATRRAAPSRKHAITLAVHFEDSLMDGHFYDIVQSDAPEFQTIARRLSQDTARHREVIRSQSRELHAPFA